MSRDKEKIAAVVVTRNRKLLLRKCLDSLLGQSHPLDGVYIVDNHSDDGTPDHLLDNALIGPIENSQEPTETVRSVPVPGSDGRAVDVHYVRLAENTGGAGGFHEGMKRALDAGFDWLWLMDDDAMLAPDALAALVKSKRSLEALGDDPFLLNSLVLANDPADDDRLAVPLQEFAANGDPKRGVYHWRLSEVRHMVKDGLYRWACPFNGTFVSARLTSRIGLPNREFFIWGDERDFFWRTARRFEIGTVVDSRIYHPTSRETVFDWKQYYDIRNQIVLNRRFRYTHLRNGRLILLSLVRGARHGRWGLTLALRAIRDGLAGRLGKRDDLQP